MDVGRGSVVARSSLSPPQAAVQPSVSAMTAEAARRLVVVDELAARLGDPWAPLRASGALVDPFLQLFSIKPQGATWEPHVGDLVFTGELADGLLGHREPPGYIRHGEHPRIPICHAVRLLNW